MKSIIKKKTVLAGILLLGLQSCQKQGYALERIQGNSVNINNNIPSDSIINQFIAPYKESVDNEMDKVLAHTPKALSKKDSKYNTAIGNMMADAVMEMANPIFQKRTGYPFHAVLLNYGGIRSGLNAGDITTRAAYEIMPFENEVVVVELSGYQMKELFAYLSRGAAHPIAGMEVHLNADGTIRDGKVQGQEIIDNETYFVATSDYLQKGGDSMNFFAKPISLLEIDYKIRNVLIDYFAKHDTIAPVQDNRFTKLSR
ncbi:MAG: 2',3'-cyclic-nucleotide 2'-phosphodiesterase (5'-nucleotidase family) [Flavobacteriales bacterium]|jgi:2',3'-cyclic-nucleotide 2'-phosphodiesterase (5'-nucleotidase family)